MDVEGDIEAAIHLQYIYNNEETKREDVAVMMVPEADATDMIVETEDERRMRAASSWSLKRSDVKPKTPYVQKIKPPIQCPTCGILIFAYSPRTVYGGYCYSCDVDAAFEAGKKRSESQTYVFKIADVQPPPAPTKTVATRTAAVPQRQSKTRK